MSITLTEEELGSYPASIDLPPRRPIAAAFGILAALLIMLLSLVVFLSSSETADPSAVIASDAAAAAGDGQHGQR